MTVTIDRVVTTLASKDLRTKILSTRILGESTVPIILDELRDICSQFDRAEATSSQITTRTTPRWRGGKKNAVVSQVGNPADIVKVSRYNCNLGIWGKQVNNKVDREIGRDMPDYHPLPPNGKEYVGGSPLMVKSSDPTQFYLSVIPVGFWAETKYMLGDTLLPNLHSEEYKWEGESRIERETGLSDAPLIRTPKLENIVCLAPWGRGEDGRFQPIELQFCLITEPPCA